MTTQKIVELALKATGKWQSIALQNACQLASLAMLEEAYPIVQESLKQNRLQRIARLQTMDCPEVIMTNEQETLEKIKTGKHPHLQTITRFINRKTNQE